MSILFHHYKELKECISEVEQIQEASTVMNDSSKKKEWLTSVRRHGYEWMNNRISPNDDIKEIVMALIPKQEHHMVHWFREASHSHNWHNDITYEFENGVIKGNAPSCFMANCSLPECQPVRKFVEEYQKIANDRWNPDMITVGASLNSKEAWDADFKEFARDALDVLTITDPDLLPDTEIYEEDGE